MSSAKPLYLQAIDALRTREALLRVLIFTMVTVLFWIGFSIFFSQQKTKVKVDTQKHTLPLNPNIDAKTVDELATRKTYTEQELSGFPIYDRIVGEDKVSHLVIAGTDETTPAFSASEAATFVKASSASATTAFEAPTATASTTLQTSKEATSSATE